MTVESWRRVDARIDALLERVDKAKRDERYQYLIGYCPTENPAFVTVDGAGFLMMSGYSYLGLNQDPRVVSAAQEAIARYGTGTHGARLLAGSVPIHRELERTIARIKGTDDAIVYGSGYAANVGTIAALCGPRDCVFLDKEDHASIIDGCRLSGAKLVTFRHNDPVELDRKLSQVESSTGSRLVIVDAVFSMNGDIADLPALREVCDRHSALLMVDEAHSLGLLGSRGFGIEDHFGRSDLVDVRMGTLSKAIPSVGGYIAGSTRLVEFLKHTARPFIFSGALSPGQAAAALSGLNILEEEPWRVHHTRALGDRLRNLLQEAGFDTGSSETAIIPIITGTNERALEFAWSCQQEGLIALPIVAPAVPPGTARLRVTVTAAHQERDVEFAAKAFVSAARRSKLLER